MNTIEKSKVSTITNSWRVSDLVVISGSPSIGKTALMISLAVERAGDNNIPVAIFSLELQKAHIMRRFAAGIGVSINSMCNISKPAVDIDDIRTKAKHLSEVERDRGICIDYSQLIHGDEVLKSLQSIASEFNITIVCFSKHPRNLDMYEDELSELSDSEKEELGATKYADRTLFIYRKRCDDSSIEDDRAEIISIKHSDDSLDVVELRYDKPNGVFVDKTYIIDKPAISIDYFRTKAKHLCEVEGVKVVFVDFLQLMQGDEKLKSLKSIASELNITIVCLSQLSCIPEEVEDKRPQLSDLKKYEHEATEYADTILFIHRDEYYDWDLEDDRAEIIAAKHYDDSLNSLELRFDNQKGIFVDK